MEQILVVDDEESVRISFTLILKEEDISKKLKNSDIEIDLEKAGKFINQTSRIIVDNNYEPVYDYSLYEVLILHILKLFLRMQKKSKILRFMIFHNKFSGF